jgi:tyrosine-protein kinase Etk/Wzc
MENQTNYLPQDESIDIRKFVVKILRYWYWFVISIFITYTIAYLLNRYKEPTYSVSGTMLISEEKKSSVDLLISSLDRYSARKNMENEIAVLKSYKMAYKTISELDDFEISYYTIGRVRKPMLYKSNPYRVIYDSTRNNFKNLPIFITILNKNEFRLEIDGTLNINKIVKFGEPYIDNNFSFTLFLKNDKNFVPTPSSKYFFTINDMNSLVRYYQNKLVVTANDKRGTVLALSTYGHVPAMEADYINKLMEVYIRTGLEEKNQTAINTINFIDEQLLTVVDSLHKAEEKLQNFRLTNKILDVSSEGKAIMDRLEKAQTNKATIDLQIKYYKYLQSYIDNKKDFREVMAPSIMGIADPLLNSLVADLIKMFAERSILTRNAQQNYPGLTLINAQIQNALEALKENIKQIINSAYISLNETNKQQAIVEQEIQQLPITERRLLNIERSFKLNDKIYDFLLQRRADAAISKASNTADNKVLDIASPSSSVLISPKSSQGRMTAIILGILIPLIIIILIEYFNDTIMEPKDVEKVTKVPIYGSVGHNEKMSDIPVATNPKSPLAESFRALRTNLQYIMRNKEQKVICISSTIVGEGKTFCAVNLASIIAQSNKKTLLVNLDLRKPRIHKIFNVENEKGVSTYLINRSTYEEIIFKTHVNNLYISPSGPVPPNPAELIETRRMDEFITEAKKEFDVIILDTPPIAIVTDALLLTHFSDAFIFVIRQNYSTKPVLQLVDDLYNKRSLNNVGILINDVKVNSYYGYNRRYSYGYGYYGYGYSDSEGYYGEAAAKPKLFDRIINFLFKS